MGIDKKMSESLPAPYLPESGYCFYALSFVVSCSGFLNSEAYVFVLCEKQIFSFKTPLMRPVFIHYGHTPIIFREQFYLYGMNMFPNSLMPSAVLKDSLLSSVFPIRS